MITTANPVSYAKPLDGANGSGDGLPVQATSPYQVIGFSPLTPCDIDECRTWFNDCCIKNPVFAELGTRQIYNTTTNDQTPYLVNFPTYTTGSTNATFTSFVLQKWNGSAWQNVAGLGSNMYGTYYPFGSLAISTYKGYNIEWRYVLDNFGEGCYRFYVSTVINNRESCMIGEVFSLRIFDCRLAHGTVRFDSYLFDGSIASIDDDGRRFNLCGIVWRDQFRVYGLFGDEESDRAKRQIELTDGKIKKTRDELIQKFKYISSVMPKWYHDRFKAYGCMADELRITDYNWNNPDYLIKLKLVVSEDGMKPNYKRSKRNFFCEYVFKEGYQNVSRSLCCDTSTIKR